VESCFSAGGQRVDLIDEQDDRAHGLSSLEYFSEAAFTLSVELAHDSFKGHVDKGDVDLVRDDLGRGGLTTARRSFKEDTLGPVSFILHSSDLSNLVVNISLGQGQQNSVFNLTFDVLVSSQVLPV